MRDERLRAFALVNVRDAVKRLQACDSQEDRASGRDVVAREARWRRDQLDAAHKWAIVAEALRPDAIEHVGVKP